VRRELRCPLAALGAASLALTAGRLAGELSGGPEWLFGRAAGGGGSLVGIGWLIPVAGAWLGHRLARAGVQPRPRAGSLVGAGVLGVASVFTVAKLWLPVTVGTFLFVVFALMLLAMYAFRAWPELARALLAFALVQRVPVLAITVFAVAGDWGTHYERLAPGSPPMPDAARVLVLCVAQLGLWIPMTLLGGVLAGVLVARRASAAP
jgi:hypothetical protein